MAGFFFFFVEEGPGFGLGFELVAEGFFDVAGAVVAGLAGAGVCADETGASRHAATRAAARFKAREN